MPNFISTPFIEASMKQVGDAHVYTTKNLKSVGITTILGATKPEQDSAKLEDWKIKTNERWGTVSNYIFKTSGPIGTDVHCICEAYLKGEDYTPNFTISKGHFENLREYLGKIDNIRALEKRIYSEKLGIAGTVDCVAEYGGKLSVIDFKTKRSRRKEEWMLDSFIQCTSYALMFSEITGVKIDQIVVLVSTEDGHTQEFIRNPDDYVTQLKERIEKYNFIT